MKAFTDTTMKFVKNFIRKYTKPPKYNSVLEAFEYSALLRIMSGSAVVLVCHDPHDHHLRTRFSLLGFACFLFWVSLYSYCTYIVYSEDQTILRKLYDTKLKHYGDAVERIAATVFMVYCLRKVPFKMSGFVYGGRMVDDLDKAIKQLGVTINYSSIAKSVLITSIAQLVTGCTRFLSVWVTLTNMKISIPIEIMFQGSIYDFSALITTAYYCYNLIMLMERYKIINDLLTEIKRHKSWRHEVFMRCKQPPHVQRALELQDKLICEKIKACAIIYSKVHKLSKAIHELYGPALALKLLVCLLYIILNLFYFMEATASGMFHDPLRYIYFLVYVFWRILYSIAVVYLDVYFTQLAVQEAARTPYIMHEIINNNACPSITAEAMQFSLQLLHQAPVFTAWHLIELDYPLLLKGARAVTSYLVMLLQYAADETQRLRVSWHPAHD